MGSDSAASVPDLCLLFSYPHGAMGHITRQCKQN